MMFPVPVLNILKFVFIVICVFRCSFCDDIAKDCESGKLDLVIILDTSKSVGEKNFPKCINFIENLLGTLPIEPDLVRVSLVRYSNEAQVVSYLSQAMAKTEKLNDVSRIKYIKGSTFTNLALRITDREVLTSDKGDRHEVSDLVILITDGESSDPILTMEETESLKQRANLKIFTIGVGKEIHEEELQAIASDFGYSVNVDSFTELANLIQNMTSVTCTESTKEGLVSFDELPKDIFYSDHVTPALDPTLSTNDVTQTSSYVTRRPDNVRRKSDHYTQATRYVKQSTNNATEVIDREIEHATKAIDDVTNAIYHVTTSTNHTTEVIDHTIDRAKDVIVDNVTVASDHVIQSTGHAVQAIDHATEATNNITQATGHVTQARGYATLAKSDSTPTDDDVTKSSDENEKANSTGIDTGNITSAHNSETVQNITKLMQDTTATRGYNLTLGGVRTATFLTYLGIAIGAFVATLGAITFVAIMSLNKCSTSRTTEL